jgi:hypothetical protein
LTYIEKSDILGIKKDGIISLESRSSNRQAFNKTISLEFSIIEPDQIRNIRAMGTGVDISPDGLGISTNQALAAGDILRLNIPDDKEKAAKAVFAEVVWSRPSNSHFRTGLRFLR